MRNHPAARGGLGCRLRASEPAHLSQEVRHVGERPLAVGGLALIVKGGDLFVSSSIRIAELLRMPRVVIGSTLVSLVTTTPEVTVAIMSGVEGASDLAVGNAVGSCVCNFELILGLLGILRAVEVHPKILRLPLAAMAACAALVFLASWDLVGAAAALHPATMTRGVQLLSFPGLLLGTMLTFGFLYSCGRLSRREGGCFLGFYVLYLGVVLTCTSPGVTD